MLVTDALGGVGGIARYNRDIIRAFDESEEVVEVTVLPRVAPATSFNVPTKVSYKLRAADSTMNYLKACSLEVSRPSAYDLVYCGHINLMPLAVLMARIRRVPIILTIYGIDAWLPPKRMITRWFSRKADYIFSISELTAKRFLDWSCCEPTKYELMPNAIHREDFGIKEKNKTLEKKLGVSGRKIIMTLGRMSTTERYKGFDEVLEILPRIRQTIPNILYLAAGDGDDRPRLEAKAKCLGVSDQVLFSGRIPESEKTDIYNLADAYVMPSSGEGLGFVVCEALACGLPIVASKIDGTFEAIRDGQLGTAVNPNNPEELYEGILQALRCSKHVPVGLEYFDYKNFRKRLYKKLSSIGFKL
jgi:glycosyltransferase involved in cell wall biosynthesis